MRRPVADRGFRYACLTSLDYLSRTKYGRELTPEKKAIINLALILGVQINDYYDINRLNKPWYKQIRKTFKNLSSEREDDFRKYRRSLSDLERNRPVPSEIANSEERLSRIKKYREDVNRLSLAFSFSVAFDIDLDEVLNIDYVNDPYFKGFFNLIMAMGVVDDMVGRKGDVEKDRPSFYTAVCDIRELTERKASPSLKPVFSKLNDIFNSYFNEAKSVSPPSLKPIISAVRAVRMIYPTIVGLAKEHKIVSNLVGDFLSQRDLNNL